MKLTKKRIDEVAQKLRMIYMERSPLPPHPWKRAPHRLNWLRVAEFVLTDLPLDQLSLPTSKRRTKKPKVCRLVNGKPVCK